jgi:hypothetical protein
MLYQGSVHNMIENNSFFELQSDDNEQLKLALQNHASVEKIVEEGPSVLGDTNVLGKEFIFEGVLKKNKLFNQLRINQKK